MLYGHGRASFSASRDTHNLLNLSNILSLPYFKQCFINGLFCHELLLAQSQKIGRFISYPQLPNPFHICRHKQTLHDQQHTGNEQCNPNTSIQGSMIIGISF